MNRQFKINNLIVNWKCIFWCISEFHLKNILQYMMFYILQTSPECASHQHVALRLSPVKHGNWHHSVAAQPVSWPRNIPTGEYHSLGYTKTIYISLSPSLEHSVKLNWNSHHIHRLHELVEDCGPLPIANDRCKLDTERTNKSAPFPYCCPKFACEPGVKLEYPEIRTEATPNEEKKE